MKNTIKIKEMIKYTLPKQAEYIKITRLAKNYTKLCYLKHEQRLVYDYGLKDYTGEFYYKVYLLSEKEKKQITVYVNQLSEKLKYLDKLIVNNPYYLKIEYHLTDIRLKKDNKLINYYIDELKKEVSECL